MVVCKAKFASGGSALVRFLVSALILSLSTGILSYFFRMKEVNVHRMFIVVGCVTPEISCFVLTFRVWRRVFAL